ncbi:hypothetical protein [Cyclobacterium sp.]|uniref:hypothetical protein n=1 Tax=Cyclobacterium sp. TaxID=1966343 RepID=UPI0019B8C791|nr:hypothetical protein [Cyclobacterium sp.]MBD3626491.1 hypothetical protein [Cyclobacterium sp.]
MFYNQFILTKSMSFAPNWTDESWNKENIGDFFLFCHPKLNLTKKETNISSFFLLGYVHDWEFPEQSNQKIVEGLDIDVSIIDLIYQLSKLSGDFVVIYQSDGEIFLFNDACGQKEVYYDVNYQNFGSQPKLLAEVVDLVPHEDEDSINFFKSIEFSKKKHFVNEFTHVKNVKHLLPNHYLDLNSKTTVRFFPLFPREERPLKEVAQKAAVMIKGYLKSIAYRSDLALAVTGGFDSRTLFLASLEVKEKCKYYVFKHKNMDHNHYDIVLPKKITAIYQQKLHVIEEDAIEFVEDTTNFSQSVDFPSTSTISADAFKGRVYINGNIYEIARNSFGYQKNATAADLAFKIGFNKQNLPIKGYERWLKDKPGFKKQGYHYLDLFYWEERMGIWLSKGRTEMNAMGKTVKSPFNSRALIELLLSVKRKDRDVHFNKLQKEIIRILSDNNPEIMAMPVNPTLKRKVFSTLKKLHLYNLMRYIAIKARIF